MKVFVEFAAAEEAIRAIDALVGLGYLDIETYAPFPLTSQDAHAPRGSLTLGLLASAGGLFALSGAYVIQWFANAGSYPLNIGGRPAHAAPAFVPATFESLCLGAVMAVFLGFLLLERLPRLWQPIFNIDGFERASIDRFWVVVNLRAAETPDDVVRDALALHPIRIIAGEERT